MPIYEYRCRECEESFEKLVYASTVVACPACASGNVMRKLSVFRAKASSVATLPGPAPAMGGGGCCGGGCGCH
jgi:putative FmdB family regulatory protein